MTMDHNPTAQLARSPERDFRACNLALLPPEEREAIEAYKARCGEQYRADLDRARSWLRRHSVKQIRLHLAQLEASSPAEAGRLRLALNNVRELTKREQKRGRR